MTFIVKNTILSILIIFILNSIFWCISIWTGTLRFLINFDYFFLLILLSFKNKYFFYLALFFISFFDFMNIFVQIYPFIRFEDFIYLLRFSLISSDTYKLFGIIIISSILVQAILVKKIYEKELNLYLIMIFNICAFIAFYQNNFADIKKEAIKFWQPQSGVHIESGILTYLSSTDTLFAKNFKDKSNALRDQKLNSASKSLFLENIESKKIMLIINESWGVPLNSEIQKEIIKPILLLNNKKIENIQEDTLRFDGFTVAAELRELCQVIPIHYNLKNQKNGFENCLPNQMKKKGYQTVAIHGALGLMYDRKYWYPRAGFNSSLFRDQGLNLPNSRCYSFPGNCDKDIAIKVTQQFKTNQKIFLYWLTLNTHATYDLRDLVKDEFECKKYSLHENSQSCKNLKLQKQYFSILARVISSDNLKGAKVIIVGDHKPPIIEAEQTIFFDNLVPMIKFNVKN